MLKRLRFFVRNQGIAWKPHDWRGGQLSKTRVIWVPGVHGNLLYHLVMTNIDMV